MVNKLIGKMLSKDELKKLPVLIHTLTLKKYNLKKLNINSITYQKRCFYKHI